MLCKHTLFSCFFVNITLFSLTFGIHTEPAVSSIIPYSCCTVNAAFLLLLVLYFHISEAAYEQLVLFPDCLLESLLWQLHQFFLSSRMSWKGLSIPNDSFLVKENSFIQRENSDQIFINN